ncbi:class I SAM-dependent methyltransferase [Parapedobacter koreensis]|uniref:Methyltransferase domain-containing protein n=1 Tax=Parapedobacter koreensis TaxID=332977 RepID=A0A1H7LNN2_9SPHI|nr:class I SAM-dependent methyltransferase [Parapedobacter koreensis]SEL00602.1 Methyltransferase domain-containing protein [Parapedobacter koreensis]
MDDWSSLIAGAFLNASEPQQWADLGCGEGTFTYALGSLLPAGSAIHAVDVAPQRLRERVGDVLITFLQTDFERKHLPLSNLDGILLANAIHYVRDKESLIHKLLHYCKPSHTLITVEYDTVVANPWVPYPIDFGTLKTLFQRMGYRDVRQLGKRKSRYGGDMYAMWVKNRRYPHAG